MNKDHGIYTSPKEEKNRNGIHERISNTNNGISIREEGFSKNQKKNDKRRRIPPEERSIVRRIQPFENWWLYVK